MDREISIIERNQINNIDIGTDKKDVITTTEGPLLIIAGPGSGKSMTLVERTVHLIVEKSIEPQNILLSTFTEKAAKELITRISNRIIELGIKTNINEMYIGTMHSIFLDFLEDYREYSSLLKNYKILDRFDQQYFIYSRMRQFNNIDNIDAFFESKQLSHWYKSRIIAKYVAKVGEEALAPEILIKSDTVAVKVLGEIYKLYNDLLVDNNCLDFTYIQTAFLNLINEHEELLEEIRGKIKYMMIDEYQDTNTIQEEILFKIMNPEHKNICVVGDEDQSLYRFRGATVRNILEFQDNFADGECKIKTLETNYRSHPGIINFYNRWMDLYDWTEDSKRFRYDKQIKPQAREFVKNPSVIKVSSKGSEKDWYEEVYQFIHTLKEKEILTDFNQIAFLFSSVKHERVIGLHNYLEKQGIGVFSPRSAMFFNREETRLILGALIFIFPTLFEILGNRSYHKEIHQYLSSCKRLFANSIRKNKEKHKYLLSWCNQKANIHLSLSENTDYSFSGLFYQLLEFSMFSQFLETDLKGKATDQRKVYNLSLFSKLLTKFEAIYEITVFTPKNIETILKNFFNRYLKFLVKGGMEEYEDFVEYAPSGAVSFMTIHQAKGLEFPIVMVDSLNSVPKKRFKALDETLENNYYHKKMFEPLERRKFFDFYRLYYTAFSRAENLLVLSGNEKEGGGLSKLPSKYFAPVYEDLFSWRDKKFDLNKLALGEIKPVNIKSQYAFTSDIVLYEKCPLQYKFFRELEFVPIRLGGSIFGSLVHQTIEDIHKAVLRGEREVITDANIERWFENNYRSLSKALGSYLSEIPRKSALKQVKNYNERNKHRWDEIVEAEADISLAKEEYILKGTVDLIEGNKNTVEVVDFKSDSHKPNVNDPEERKKLQIYRKQLEVYSHIIQERTGRKVSKMNLYYTSAESESPYITYDYDEKNIDKTINEFDKIVDRIEAKDFDHKSIDPKMCNECDMRFYCNQHKR